MPKKPDMLSDTRLHLIHLVSFIISAFVFIIIMIVYSSFYISSGRDNRISHQISLLSDHPLDVSIHPLDVSIHPLDFDNCMAYLMNEINSKYARFKWTSIHNTYILCNSDPIGDFDFVDDYQLKRIILLQSHRDFRLESMIQEHAIFLWLQVYSPKQEQME